MVTTTDKGCDGFGVEEGEHRGVAFFLCDTHIMITTNDCLNEVYDLNECYGLLS